MGSTARFPLGLLGIGLAGLVVITAPEARGNGVAPEARGNGVAPEARGNGVAPEARGNETLPEARGNETLPEAGGNGTPAERPFSQGQHFGTLDAYLAHLETLGPIGVTWFQPLPDGRFEMIRRRPPGTAAQIVTRQELLDRFGFAE